VDSIQEVLEHAFDGAPAKVGRRRASLERQAAAPLR
jgi:hypothetical protein